MSWLAKLNPSRSLYGRIFLWFWLATVLMIASSIWLAKQLSDEVEYKPLRTVQLAQLNATKRKLQGFLYSEPGVGKQSESKLKRILSHMGKRQQSRLLLVEPKTQSFIYGFSGHILADTQAFLEVLNQQSPLSIRVGRDLFIGPAAIIIGDSNYLLFVGRPAHRGFFWQVRGTHPAILLGVALMISGLLCFLLAWSLVKPIKQMQQASQGMASGDLSSRVGTASERSDEMGRLGRDFNHMAQQVESLLLSQKRLLADISHELRSPLARLQLAIGIAQQQPDVEQSQTTNKQLERIEKESQRMEQMIAQVLTLSRLEAEDSRTLNSSVNLTELLQELVKDAQFEAQVLEKHVSLHCAADICLQGDPQLLLSALENILRNAVKYAQHRIEVCVQQLNHRLNIVVSDDGEGLPEQDLEKVFRPFYRVSAARERDIGGVGVGLGLAIAQRAIYSHGGKVWAENRNTGGLRITIKLEQRA